MLKETSTANWLRIIVNSGLIFSLILAFTLWSSYQRILPEIPCFDFVKFNIPVYITIGLYCILILSTFTCIFYGIKACLLLTILLSFCLIIFDINRLQPYIYLFLSFNILLLLFYSNYISEEKMIKGFQWILVAVYFWSGIHKLNQNYYEVIYLWMIEPYTSFFENNVIVYLLEKSGPFTPFIEFGMALGLLFTSTRRWSCIILISMHLFIILTLGIIRQFNYIVIPWNLVMCVLLYVLFYKNSNFNITDIKFAIKNKIILIILLQFWILPLFNFAGKFDSYLSHDLYSGKAVFGFIYFTEEGKQSLPNKMLPHLEKSEEGQYYISLTKWSLDELQVPIYPEVRVLKKYKEYFKKITKEEIILVFYTHNNPVVIE